MNITLCRAPLRSVLTSFCASKKKVSNTNRCLSIYSKMVPKMFYDFYNVLWSHTFLTIVPVIFTAIVFIAV